MIALEAPERVPVVGLFYRTFDQVSTERAVEYLEQAYGRQIWN